MANKKSESTSLEVSSLPLAQDDSPLVIDLPDGQKLVVGRLANGSVIEVATWRGTGRPDSRTSRLMLGMSSSTSASEASPADPSSPRVEPSGKRLFDQLKILLGPLRTRIRTRLAKRKASNATSPDAPLVASLRPSSVPPVDTEVEEWLESIIKKSERNFSKGTATSPKTSQKRAVSSATKKVKKKKSQSGSLGKKAR